ncbi:MAG: hypothetical protein JW881_04480 [Spirochaetales bacterium]|nr:hypothetical protein [Spirochaetales bacterium]
MYRFIAFVFICLIMTASCQHQTIKETEGTTMKKNEPKAAKQRVIDVQTPFAWESSGILINPKSDERHTPVSIKDPTIVFFEGKWHIYATIYDTAAKTWSMVYLSFSDWSEADTATQYYMDANPALRGYKCAPQVFYFKPQKKWYLIYQSQPPTYSTADTLGGPSEWSAPKYFYKRKPEGAPGLWIDYWIICDEANAYLFFSGDDGKLYRSQTKVKDFPEGFGEITVVMSFPERRDLFEGCCVYKIKGRNRYLLLNECANSSWRRYYKAFISDSIDGTWYELAPSYDEPFCGGANVTFPDGVEPWTRDFSHGELLRAGYDQTMTIDDGNLRFLYQGSTGSASSYELIPWSLGLLTQVEEPEAKSVFDVDFESLNPYSD